MICLVKSLLKLAEAKSVIERQTRPSQVVTTLAAKDPLEQKIGTSIKSAFSQFRAASQGRVSQEYIISDIGGKLAFTVKQREFDKVMEEALYDPQVAKWLADHVDDTIKLDAGFIKQFKKQLYSIGAKANVVYQDTTDELED